MSKRVFKVGFLSVVLYQWIISKFRSKELPNLVGKTIIITGANSGIGKQTALELARSGAHIILACHDESKARVAVKHISTLSHNSEVKFFQVNLASFQSVRHFASEVLNSEPHIHVLINNAGIACPKYRLTDDGYEMQLGVNHLGHFLLTLLLLERIVQSAPARIINVTSGSYKGGQLNFKEIEQKEDYDAFQAYCNSRLANVLFTKELSRYLKGTGVTTYAADPGLVRTELFQVYNSISLTFSWTFMIAALFFKSAKEGAETPIFCAISEKLCKDSGCYYSECQKVETEGVANSSTASKTLWKFSEKATGIQISKLKLKKKR